MIIKLLLVLGMLVVGILVFRSGATATKLALSRMAASLIVLIGISAVLFPGAVQAVAKLVGVGRGTDLVLYVVTMSFLLVSVALYRKTSDLEDRYVALARRVAIDEAIAREPRGPDQVNLVASNEFDAKSTNER
jgi:small membrane protein